MLFIAFVSKIYESLYIDGNTNDNDNALDFLYAEYCFRNQLNIFAFYHVYFILEHVEHQDSQGIKDAKDMVLFQ